MNIKTVIFLLSFVIVSGKNLRKGVKKKVADLPLQFPWQAYTISEFPDHSTSYAGAVLVSSTRLLTAAHNWFDGTDYGVSMTVYLGRNRSSLIEIETEKVVIHEEYDSEKVVNDIAVVYLPYDVDLNNLIQPVNLLFGSEENLVNSKATTSGFAVSDELTIEDIKFVNVTVISNEACAQQLGPSGTFVQDTNICTVGNCSGDSGGPLVVYSENKGFLIGITSFRQSSCNNLNDSPTVFTRVASYKSWIESHL